MASSLTILLLGCWLAGRSGVSGGGINSIDSGATVTSTCQDSEGSGETTMTQPGKTPYRTTPGSAEPVQTNYTIAGVSITAIVLLVLVAFVCFRKTRARKGAALRLSSTSPTEALTAPAQQDHVYASVDKGKQPQTLEPDADRLTYAELDGQTLQAKRGGPAPAPEPAQTTMYAVVNVSRGTPQ